MPIPTHRGLFGRLLPTMKLAVDLLVINIIFLVLVKLHTNIGDVNFFGRLRVFLVLLNVSFIPAAYYYHKFCYRQRTITVERMMSVAIKGVIIMAIALSALSAFVGLYAIPLRFYMELYAVLLFAIPICWMAEYLVIRHIRRRGRNSERVIIIGTGITARRIYKNLMSNDGYGLNIKGFISDFDPGNLPAPYLGNIHRLDEIVHEHQIHTIYLAAFGDNERVVQEVIRVADDNICKFYYVPSLSPFVKRNFYLAPINGALPALGLHPNPLQNPLNRILKRSFDILFSLCVLAILVPLVFIPVAIAVKMSSPGPVFFKQKRTGYRGREFYCWKFRTMKVNNDADTRQATKDDDRKTKVGDFLRKTSIDELPQFWNVLKGDMSVVGPRPHMISHTETYRRIIGEYMVRHLIKPGVTGWAQVLGYRGTTDQLWKMEKRVDCDVWYIEHWSFMFDIKIIVKTVFNAAKGEENAY